MSNADKVVDYVSALLSSLIPKPVDIALKPLIKPVGDNLKAWLGEKETQKALLEAASKAESDFRELAKDKFGNDKLTQAVASFPLHNGELFQAALQSLPSHFNETILENHLSNDLSKYWTDEFTSDEIRAGTALYLDCLRLQLLRVNGFADIVTRLAILRTDRRTEDILDIVQEILEKLSSLSTKNDLGGILRIHQLPPAPADFTGRELLITQLLNDFNSHKGATISGLTGMGGIGKTALGLAVANQIADKYPDAQIFLDLKGTTTPLSALDIMRHVILSFEPTADLRALDDAKMSAAYQSVLHGKKVLLFLDNARSAEQIASLRPPETCAMLITSRWSFPVTGLKPHKVGVLEENEAIAFLLELCPRINDNADNLAKACAYLPLALRIAGSFLQVNDDWSVEKYLTQLNDRKQRLEALKQSRTDAELTNEPDLLATFELSYNQLSEENKKCWRLLGVFLASFDAGAAQAIWELQEAETTKLLSLLRRYSLLDYDETLARFSLHDLLTDYALSQMEDGEEQGIRIKHAIHYMNVMQTADKLYLSGNENILQGLRLLDLEWEHIRAGHTWAVVNIQTNKEVMEIVMDYPVAAAYCLDLRLHPRQMIEWLAYAVDAARLLGNKRKEGVRLGNLGLAYAALGDTRKAIECYEQNLVIARETGNRRGEAASLGSLGNAYGDLGDEGKAIEYHEQALIIDREIGDRRGEGIDLGNLGSAHHFLGDTRKAIEYYEQDLIIAREIGDRRGEGTVLGNLGSAYTDLGDAHKAIEYHEQALIIDREIDDRRGEGAHLGNLGNAYYALRDFSKAVEYYKQQLTIVQEIGDKSGEGMLIGV